VAAVGGVLLRKQRVGDTHFVEVGVRGKRYQARVLALPTETPDTRLTPGLEHRNHNRRTAHGFRLFVANGQQCAVSNGLDEAVPQSICRYTESSSVILRSE